VVSRAISSVLRLELDDEEIAKGLEASLTPEIMTTKPRAASISIERQGASLIFEMTSSSIAPMRALLNSYIRWITTSLEVAKLKGD
jgi:tRNA threonylcarbamoyladenosine modification (KEOPS) complex  Pcc1 subunit